MKLIIAEKPSVAKNIADAIMTKPRRREGYIENDEYAVSWCVGHLVGLADAKEYDEKYAKWRIEDLPIIPTNWKYTVHESTKKQFNVLKALMHDKRMTEVICATDAGREGELIFRLVYNKAECALPIYRLWVNSYEADTIREGIAHLESGDKYIPLYKSATARAKADWLVGVNASRYFTKLYNGNRMNVGRVRTPTLALIVEREREINGFTKAYYYTLDFDYGGLHFTSDRIDRKENAVGVEGVAKIKSVARTEKAEKPPKLFDLTSLQREANKRYGMTAQDTLNAAQKLYEGKLITYPRTDSRYLTEDMRGTVDYLLKQLVPSRKTSNVDSLYDNSKVSDHYALLPTKTAVDGKAAEIASEDERRIFDLIKTRLIAATDAPCISDAIKAEAEQNSRRFTATAKIVKSQGWKAIEKPTQEDGEDDREVTAITCKEGDTPTVTPVTVEHETAPPKRYTDSSILSAMENADKKEFDEDAERTGLGTSATRAAILEKLISDGVVVRKGKSLIPTEKGKNLIAVLPEAVKSPSLTAKWENRLTQMAQGRDSPTDFLTDIKILLDEILKTEAVPTAENLFREYDGKNAKEEIGKCPRCGSPVYENKATFYCSNRNCQFALWKNDKWFTNKGKSGITKKMAKAFLTDGQVEVKGFRSKAKDKLYDATVIMKDTGGKYVNFEMVFNSNKN